VGYSLKSHRELLKMLMFKTKLQWLKATVVWIDAGGWGAMPKEAQGNLGIRKPSI
jgi:hypothetical protein